MRDNVHEISKPTFLRSKNKGFKMSSATVFTQSAKCLRINKKDKYV